MGKRILIFFITMFVIIISTCTADAIIIYDNGIGTSAGGLRSSEAFTPSKWRIYDDFTLPQDSTIDTVWFQEGITINYSLEKFTFSIFNNDSSSGKPDTSSPFYEQILIPGDYTALQSSIAPFSTIDKIYDIEFTLPTPLGLPSGEYWLSFYGLNGSNAATTTDDTDFRLPKVATGDGFYHLDERNNRWNWHADIDTPFRLEYRGTPPIPEPATILLLGSGLLGLIGAGFRQKKHTS
ncbi:MAG: PEP-CTERM sorting domain-containing protein [Candidatus Omnitrophica bacterium]|nr:PEP-CTERM sorting domain-containing protein [Candidatus Omnitrophota bacterium]